MNKFISYKFEVNDKENIHYKTLILFQDYLLFNANSEHNAVLMDLLRLEYALYISQLTNEVQLYENSFAQLRNKYKGNNKYLSAYLEYKWVDYLRYFKHHLVKDSNTYIEAIRTLEAIEIPDSLTYWLEKSIQTHLSYLKIQNINTYLESWSRVKTPMLVSVETFNLNTVYYRVVKEDFKHKEHINYSNKLILALKNEHIILDSFWDKHKGLNIRTEFALPGFKQGVYYLITSANKDFKYQDFASVVLTRRFIIKAIQFALISFFLEREFGFCS